MKKIVHVQVIPKLSGVQKVSLDILSNIGSEYDKYMIFGASYDVDESLLASMEKFNIKPIFIDSLRRDIGWHDFKCFKELLKLFKEYHFDIIHTNSTKPGILARIAAKVSGCRCVIHSLHGISFHQYEPSLKRILYYGIEAISTLFGDYLISVNLLYLKYFPWVRRKSAIYNSLDFDYSFVPKVTKKSTNSSLCIGYLARLDDQKDPLTLLRAIKHIKDESSHSITLRIAGSGELLQECQDFVCQHALQDIVTFEGWITEKEDFFQNIDVFCLPSIYEAFGLVLLEAGYYGIPTVASNVEGIPEVIKHNHSGLLFEAKNYMLLAKHIITLCENPTLRENLGRQAQLDVIENFSFSKMISSYKEIYSRT